MYSSNKLTSTPIWCFLSLAIMGLPVTPATLTASRNLIQTTTQASAEAPDFSEPISNQTVALGRDAQLSCKINNLGNFRTAWLRVEDKGILTIHNNIITRNYRVGLINPDNKNFILTIQNVQPSDKGGYMCQINSVPMKYAIGYLDILTPPAFEEPETNNSSGQITISESSNATLSCRATGHPAPVISWRREDNEKILLAGAPGFEGTPKAEGPSLVLGPVSRLHSGAYLCIASNGVQPAASRRQVLDVQYKPIITLPETEVAGRVGQTEVQLTCHVELNPVGSYHWVRVGASRTAAEMEHLDDLALIEQDELTNSDKFDIVMRQAANGQIHMVLSVRQLERRDFGQYRCIARNSLGHQSNSIRLYESSSFSLNSMFRGSLDSAPANRSAQPPNWQDQDTEQQFEQATGRPGGSGRTGATSLSRTHTRSSWIQRPPGSAREISKALLDSRSASGAASTTLVIASQCHLLLYAALLLSYWMLSHRLLCRPMIPAPGEVRKAQIVVVSSHA